MAGITCDAGDNDVTMTSRCRRVAGGSRAGEIKLTGATTRQAGQTSIVCVLLTENESKHRSLPQPHVSRSVCWEQGWQIYPKMGQIWDILSLDSVQFGSKAGQISSK